MKRNLDDKEPLEPGSQINLYFHLDGSTTYIYKNGNTVSVPSNPYSNYSADFSSEDDSSDLDEEGLHHQDILANSSGLIVTVQDQVQARDDDGCLISSPRITDLPEVFEADQNHELSNDNNHPSTEIAEAASEASFTLKESPGDQNTQQVMPMINRPKSSSIAGQSFPENQRSSFTTSPDSIEKNLWENDLPKSCVIS